jgi:hypothetical protein
VPPLESSLSIVQDFHRVLHRFNPSISPTYGALDFSAGLKNSEW